MKRLFSLSLAAAMAVTALASTSALAQPFPGGPGRPGGPPPGFHHQGPPGYGPGWHQWHRGDRYYGNRYYVNNWHHYGLRPPPPGYRWVQNGGQFVLIAVTTGVIADIILNSR